jgi:hypothetical protein
LESIVPEFILLECGVPTLVAELPPYRPNRLAVLARTWENARGFSHDAEWALEVANPPELTALQRILARTVFNPSHPVAANWVTVGGYDKARLIGYVRLGLAVDDDIIQQWFGERDVLALLEAATSFSEMVLAVDAVNGGHERRPEVLQYVERVLGNAEGA